MSTPGHRPPDVAARLREARESRGLSHRHIADVTKVSARVVAALEDGRVDLLPPGIYRRSFVRAFAREVGLPVEETLRAFLAEHPDDLPPPGCAAQAAQAEPPVRSAWQRVLATFGAIAPLLVGVAYFARPASRPAASPPLIADAESWRPEVVPAGGFSDTLLLDARPVTMFISLSGRCQLRVVADGGLVVERSFEAGESLEVAFSEAVELSGDNAGVVQYSLNGRAGRLLGAVGEVLSVRIGRDDYPFWLSGR